MGLSRMFRRLRDPHTAVVTGVKSALRVADANTLAELIWRYRGLLGLSREQVQCVGRIITGRLDDSVDHDQASSHLRTLAVELSGRGLSAGDWLVWENLCRQLGCFAASQVMTDNALAIMRSSRVWRVRFLAHLHGGDLDGATEVWQRHHREGDEFSAQAGHYLWWWSGGQSGRFWPSPDSDFVDIIRGHPVTILGPAPSSVQSKNQPADTLVARVIMQQVLTWDATGDPLAGQCDLAYASRETRNWLRDSSQYDQLGAFQAVSFRLDNRQADLPGAPTLLRHAHDPRGLMAGGSSPNMVPLMLWDLSRVEDVSLCVAGTTFFASKTAYTTGNRRLKHTTGLDTDHTGSTGQLFERCPTFARHNVTENLTLVSNLIRAGQVDADAETREVAMMSRDEYLTRLDDLYGRDRR